MTVLEANLAALAEVQPAAAARLADLPDRPAAQWEPARSGDWTAVREGLQLASRFDPRSEARKALPAWADDTCIGLVIGLGLGYGAEALADRHPDRLLAVAEADPSWAREVLARRDLSALWSSGRVTLLLGPDAGVVGRFLAEWEAPVIGLAPWRPGEAFAPGWIDAVRAEAEASQLRAQVNRATARRFFPLWARNWRRNQPGLAHCRPVSALEGTAAGLPVVVAAAGPSLADQLPWLLRHRRQVVLVAVDTAWPALAARGLVPDVLLVLDGQYWNSRHVDLVPPEPALVVTEAVGPPRAFQLAPGRTYAAATSVPLLRRFEEGRWGPLGDLPSGGSVATAAWSLARLLGAGRVVLAGVDFGYPQGQTHVPGSQFEEGLHRKSGRLGPAETLGHRLRGAEGLSWRPAAGGGQVLSDRRMDLYRSWLAEAIAAAPGLPVHNLGLRGSRIPGAPALPEGEADRWPPVRWSPPTTPALRLAPAELSPPWPELGALVAEPESAAALEAAWEAFAAWWGPAADRWAGRARRTFVLHPSDATRKSLVELLLLVPALRPSDGSL